MHKEGEGGHYWLVAGGDVVLFASSQVPVGSGYCNSPFERLMASLEITRDEELALRKLTNEVMVMLRERHPEQDFQADERKCGQNGSGSATSTARSGRARVARTKIIKHFVESLASSMDMSLVRRPGRMQRAACCRS